MTKIGLQAVTDPVTVAVSGPSTRWSAGFSSKYLSCTTSVSVPNIITGWIRIRFASTVVRMNAPAILTSYTISVAKTGCAAMKTGVSFACSATPMIRNYPVVSRANWCRSHGRRTNRSCCWWSLGNRRCHRNRRFCSWSGYRSIGWCDYLPRYSSENYIIEVNLTFVLIGIVGKENMHLLF